jgi:prepilin-type N-terminal cleavage/methylation domain-containing protein
MNNKKRKGFNLIELMIGLLIFSTALMSLLGIFPYAFQGVAKANNVMLSTSIARKTIEYIKANVPFDKILNNDAYAMLPDSYKTLTMVTKVNGVESKTVFTVSVISQGYSSSHSQSSNQAQDLALLKVIVKYNYKDSQIVGTAAETLIPNPSIIATNNGNGNGNGNGGGGTGISLSASASASVSSSPTSSTASSSASIGPYSGSASQTSPSSSGGSASASASVSSGEMSLGGSVSTNGNEPTTYSTIIGD